MVKPNSAGIVLIKEGVLRPRFGGISKGGFVQRNSIKWISHYRVRTVGFRRRRFVGRPGFLLLRHQGRIDRSDRMGDQGEFWGKMAQWASGYPYRARARA